jgi:hypothetical protein
MLSLEGTMGVPLLSGSENCLDFSGMLADTFAPVYFLIIFRIIDYRNVFAPIPELQNS